MAASCTGDSGSTTTSSSSSVSSSEIVGRTRILAGVVVVVALGVEVVDVVVDVVEALDVAPIEEVAVNLAVVGRLVSSPSVSTPKGSVSDTAVTTVPTDEEDDFLAVFSVEVVLLPVVVDLAAEVVVEEVVVGVVVVLAITLSPLGSPRALGGS